MRCRILLCFSRLCKSFPMNRTPSTSAAPEVKKTKPRTVEDVDKQLKSVTESLKSETDRYERTQYKILLDELLDERLKLTSNGN